MPWLRSGDNAATYPKLLSVRADSKSDERAVNEVAGWLWRCSTQSAGHMTDYTIDVGTAEMLGGPRTAELVRLCKKTGLLTEERRGGLKVYVMIDDPEFIHIRLRKEVEHERQQRDDTRDPRLKVPILRRDGDNCRWCGVLVQWLGRRSNRRGTLDHLVPDEPGTVATMVVACLGCNSGRKDQVDTWTADHELRPAPERPNWGATTAKYLTEHDHPTAQNVRLSDDGDDQRPARAAGAERAPGDGVRPATQRSDGPAGDGATTPPNAAPNANGQVDRTRSAGSGRVGSGSGLEGLGLDGDPPPDRPPPDPPSPDRPPAPRRRGRRGGSRNTRRPGGDR